MYLDNSIIEQLNRIKQHCQSIKPAVVIQCLAYNHEPFIRDALDGFIMQKTDFPFVAIVHDDASTDKTAMIIREYSEKYPDIILPIFEKENLYSKRDGSIRRIMDEACKVAGVKYIALCEGDDYWIDPNKLQIQVDFLEGNPDYGLCYTKAQEYSQEKKKLGGLIGNMYSEYNQLIYRNSIPTATVMLRKSLSDMYYKEIMTVKKDWEMGDYPLWLYCACKSKIFFMVEVTSVYRVLVSSASHSKNYLAQLKFEKSASDIRLYFCDLFHNKLTNKDIIKLRLLNTCIQMRIAIIQKNNSNDYIKYFRKQFIKNWSVGYTDKKLLGWFFIPRITSIYTQLKFHCKINH